MRENWRYKFFNATSFYMEHIWKFRILSTELMVYRQSTNCNGKPLLPLSFSVKFGIISCIIYAISFGIVEYARCRALFISLHLL